MSGRTWGLLSVASGVFAVVLFIVVVLAYGSRGTTVGGGPAPRPTTGQTVDSELTYGAGTYQRQAPAPATAAPAATAVSGTDQQVPSASTSTNSAPDTSQAANPFTTGR